jgi:hypothetical protein
MNRFFRNKTLISNLIKRGFTGYRGKGGMADAGSAQSKDQMQKENKYDSNMKDQNDYKDEQKGYYSQASNRGQNEFGSNKDGIDSKNPLGKDANMGKQHTDNMSKGSSVKPDNTESYQSSNKGSDFLGTIKNAAAKVAAGFESATGFTQAQKAEGQDMAMKSNVEKKMEQRFNTDNQSQGQSQFERSSKGQGQTKDQSLGQDQQGGNRAHEQTASREFGASDDLTEARKFGQDTFDSQKGPGLNNQNFTGSKVGRETTGDMNASNMERDNIRKDQASSQSSQKGSQGSQGIQDSYQTSQGSQDSQQDSQGSQRMQKGDNLNKRGSGSQDTPHGNFKI